MSLGYAATGCVTEQGTSQRQCTSPGKHLALFPMYITDLTHFLDKSGAIGPVKGPARAMAQFHVDVTAHASDATGHALAAPRCFKCKKSAVECTRAHDDAIVWACPTCRTEGRISNWQGSLWDLRDRPRSHS